MASIPQRPDLQVEPVAAMGGPNSPIMTSPTGSLIGAPLVSPEPAYIASKEAAFIITREVLVEYHMVDEEDITQMQDSSLSQISPTALGNVNAFLDRILLNILSNARSLSLVSLRPAVRDVLRPKLAQDAIAGADEELLECVGDEEGIDLFEDAQETQDQSWDLELAWKRARLRCMVYTRLGDMEEEDEDRYIEEGGYDSLADSRRLSGNGNMVSPPVAIWLTAILEFIGENVLLFASQASYKRCETKYGRGIAGQALHPSVVLVGDQDLEKIALSPTLGRLWRAWRKPIRSPRTSLNRTMSIDSIRHRRSDSRSTLGLVRKSSSETVDSLRPEPGSQRVSLLKAAQVPDEVAELATAEQPSEAANAAEQKELTDVEKDAAKDAEKDTEQDNEKAAESAEPVVLDPANIAIPISPDDINEIEIPWYNAAAVRASRPTSILVPRSEVLPEPEKETSSTENGEAQVIKTLRRMRSGSFPSTKFDFEALHAYGFKTEKEKAEEQAAEAQTGKEVSKTSEEKSKSKDEPKTVMSGTLSGPDDFQTPAQLPAADLAADDVSKAEKRLSTVSQRRRSKRWSHYSNTDRKSQVSEASEPNGPVLFSRSDYTVEPHEHGVPVAISTDVPAFKTQVTVPTPVAELPPASEIQSDKRSNELSTQLTGSGTGQEVHSSGDVSSRDISDDDGSGQIAGLKDAQEHMGMPKEESSKARPVSMISPLMEAADHDDDAPISPISPEEHHDAWGGEESQDVSPIERRRRSMLPPANTAPEAVAIPAVAPVPAQIARDVGLVSAPTLPPTRQPATQPVSQQTVVRQEATEQAPMRTVVTPGLASPDGNMKDMPDIPKSAQVDKLAAAAAAHANVAVPTPDDLYRSIQQPQTGNLPAVIPQQISNTPAVPPKAQASNAPVVASKPQAQPSNAPAFTSKPKPQTSNAPNFSKIQPNNAPVLPPKQANNAPVIASKQVSNAPTIASKQPSNAPNFAGRTAPAPPPPRGSSKEGSPASQARQTVRQRDMPMVQPVQIPVEPVITSVTPAPGPPVASTTVSNVIRHSPEPPRQQINTALQTTIHRKEVSQDGLKQSGGPTPLQLGPSPTEGTISKLLERRKQLPQVETVNSERAGVQRLTPSPTNANDGSKQLPPRSMTEAVVQVSNAPAIKRKPASRQASKSGDEVLNGMHPGNNDYGQNNAEKAKEFNQLIDSNETIQYTLTPQNLRGAQAQNQVNAAPMDRNRSQSGSNSTLASAANMSRSSSRTFAGFPVKIPLGAFRSDSRVGNTTRSGLAPREPKNTSESIREFADFMRSTGPPESRSGGSAPMPSNVGMRTGKNGPQPIRSQDIMAKPSTASLPSGTRSPSSASMPRVPSMIGGKKLVARDPQASSSGVSDLIDFMREESPNGPTAFVQANGAGRVTSTASYGGSINSTQESFKSSTHSYTGLLSGSANGTGGNIAGSRSSGNSYLGGMSDDSMPVRKSRKPRDPYAIDDDDDILMEEEDEDGYGAGGANEESLADFLGNSHSGTSNNRVSGGLASHPPSRFSANSVQSFNNVRGSNAGKVSSIGRPIPAAGIPTRASLKAREGEGSGGGNTLDLADFLKNSGPPPGRISRPEDDYQPAKKSSGGFSKVFGGRRQKA